MGIDYAAEKFSAAMRCAIASTKSLQERLESVTLGVFHLERNDFEDDETWKRFEAFLDETTKCEPQGKEGSLRATTSQMSNEDAAKLLQEALDLYSDVSEQHAQHLNDLALVLRARTLVP